jgi:transposase
MPAVNIEAMNKHLAEIGTCVTAGAIALLIVDRAGWHTSPKLVVPQNVVLLKLPPYAPELNSAENIWEYLRGNALSHQVWETYEDILDACCDAWNSLMRTPEIVRSIATRKWAQVRT